MDYTKYYKKQKTKPTKTERDDYIDVRESTAIDKTIYILLIVALILIPLFIKAHLAEFVSPSLTFMSTGIQADIFSYYKYIFLIIITALIALLFLYKVLFLGYSISKSYVNLFLAILAFIIVLSAVFSPYKSLALTGMFNRHEGTIAYICYLAIFFIAANTKFSTKQLHGFLYTLYLFVITNMLLGFSLFNGENIQEIGWINNFILGSVPEGAQVSEGAKLWSTLSNPNYISGIGSVLAALFLTWSVFDKNKIRSGINVIVAVLSFLMVLTSFSTSGFITMLVLLPVIFVLIFFNEQKAKSFVVLLAFVILATSIYIPLATKNPRVWNETFGFVIKENPFLKPQATITNPNFFALEDVTSSTNSSKIQKVSMGDSNRKFSGERLQDIFLPAKAYAEGNNNAGSTEKYEIPTLPAPGISAGSGRAYIWDKTFETAMKRPIFGYGLDTFTYVFPQNDRDKVAGLGTYNIIVDKPHNMYLGLLIGSGFIALLAFILLVGSILIKGIKTVWRRQTPQQENAVMLALFTASFAYLVQGLVNDSVIGSAVIFWVLLGVLVSLLDNRNVV